MVNTRQRAAAAVMSASLLVFGACSGQSEKSDSARAATSGGDVARPDSAAGAVAPGAAATPPPASSGAASSAAATTGLKITGGDREILQVLAVVDQTEMRDGQLAQKKATNAQVKSYARELVNEHTKSLQQDREVAKSANIDLSGVMMSGKADTAGPTGATGVTADLINMHTQTIDQVRKLEGAAFDSAFVNAQVKGHQEVLALLQSAQAQNPAVQQHVAAAVKAVQSHLEKGQQLQQALSSGASASPTDTTSKSKTKSDTSRPG
jgi:putative membrane protein